VASKASTPGQVTVHLVVTVRVGGIVCHCFAGTWMFTSKLLIVPPQYGCVQNLLVDIEGSPGCKLPSFLFLTVITTNRLNYTKLIVLKTKLIVYCSTVVGNTPMSHQPYKQSFVQAAVSKHVHIKVLFHSVIHFLRLSC